MIIVRCFFVAAVLAGLVAVIGGAAFTDGDMSALHYLASFGHPEIALAFIKMGTDMEVAVDLEHDICIQIGDGSGVRYGNGT